MVLLPLKHKIPTAAMFGIANRLKFRDLLRVAGDGVFNIVAE